MVFDIETIPDIESGKRLYDLEGLSDQDVAKAMFALRQQQTGNEFLSHPLHRIAAISIVLATRDHLRVWSLGDPESNEKELIERFFAGVDKYQPVLVSWNGGGFDLPVLHYRSLLHGVAAPRYWEVGDEDRDFRYNNYLSRFHWRHIDLMDVLSGYQMRAVAPLDMVASMLGFPGKMGMDGSKVWDAWQAGEIESIRDYCETDVLNTYLVYLRFQLIRGLLSDTAYEIELARLHEVLVESGKDHLLEFSRQWRGKGFKLEG
jgi:predicted PolB exonuclease-like 3'-5' exonuclease